MYNTKRPTARDATHDGIHVVLSIEAAHLPWFVDATSLKLNQLNEYYTI